MIDTVVGTAIMIAAVSSLVLAIEIGDSVIRNAGKYPLTEYERLILVSAGYSDKQSIDNLQSYLENLPTDQQ